MATRPASHARVSVPQLSSARFAPDPPSPLARVDYVCIDVYRGRIRGDNWGFVATKVLRVSAQNFSENPEHLKDAARELHTWSKCRHRNVLRLRGLANFRGRIGMVSPWMNKGPLPGYLKNYPAAENPQANRIDICRQICEGLSYLHNTEIIHGDLKGANVLVSEDGTPVLADFGNSTLKDRGLKFTQATDSDKLTARWSAPKRVISKPSIPPTKALDVYSLGMVRNSVLVMLDHA
ncbi:tyrosine kinase domain protein, partial [Rhizoctonia solani AG-3 Rhs1AP]